VDVANATYMSETGTVGDRYAYDRSNAEIWDPRVFDFLTGESIRASDLATKLGLT
jgi:hypothetical protein